MRYLLPGRRVLVKASVAGWSMQGTFIDRAYDGAAELFVVRLDSPREGRRYVTLSRDEFLY